LSGRRRGVAPGAATALFLIFESSAAWAGPTSAEVKGLWVVRTALLSPDTVDRVVEDASRGGFNALFVQVRGRGDAFYSSRVVGRSPLLGKDRPRFDPLARLLERARARGLEVHAWVNVLLTAHFGLALPSSHVLRLHPEWVMVPKAAARAGLGARPQDLLRIVGQAARGDGDVEGYYVSPSAPGAAAHLEEVVRELVQGYALDGLHLDFIRYPGPDYDYSRAALEGFRKMRRSGEDLLAGPLRDPQGWDAYRRATLTTLVSRLTGAARAVNPRLRISAAVAPDEAQAVSQKFQDWPRWLADGLLDAICPMAYTPDSRIFRAQIERAVAITGGRSRVWAGIGAYRLTLEGTVEKIRLARLAGAAGIVVFSHESLGHGDMDRLREQALSRAASPVPPDASVPAGR
jgi:uncharacterized lipoprotein YddW (UPF0748 family)